MTDARTLFTDGILDANVTHGVVRLTLAQTGPDGKPFAAGQLVLPLVQLPGFANGLVNLLRQVETRMKEAQTQQGGQPAGDGEATAASAPAPSIPSAFRFGGS
jgi:hypothetical protein